ncbi:MAG: TPM domain-containing protein [Chlorobi bacterium]|nr:TPM domain-containing protein [Chlorobiota bacterium]
MNKIVFLVFLSFYGIIAQGQSVIDNGNFFSESEITALTAIIQKIKNETTVENMVYTTMSLKRKNPLEYGLKIAEKYHVGKKGINNGILILVSKTDRKVQILTGHGIEWIIPETETKKIVNRMVPYFKQQDFFGGVKNALAQIEKKVSRPRWKIYEIPLNKISENDLGKIIRFKQTSKSGKTKYKYPVETDPQFSSAFQIRLETGLTVFKLFYSKYMNDLVNTILTNKNAIIYARLTDWKNKRLELLGVE